MAIYDQTAQNQAEKKSARLNPYFENQHVCQKSVP